MLEKSGHTVVLANDKDKYACMTYRHNFPHVTLIEGNIRDIDKTSSPISISLPQGFRASRFRFAEKVGALPIRAVICFSK